MRTSHREPTPARGPPARGVELHGNGSLPRAAAAALASRLAAAQVNHEGVIVWHGQVNRRGLLSAVATVLRAEAAMLSKAEKDGASVEVLEATVGLMTNAIGGGLPKGGAPSGAKKHKGKLKAS